MSYPFRVIPLVLAAAAVTACSRRSPDATALARKGIDVEPNRPARLSAALAELAGHDAVIISNVPRAVGGLNDPQDAVLAAYVRDLGAGLLIIDGNQAFGAGAGQRSQTE